MPVVIDGTNGIDTPDLASAGPITGTTGTFSGAVQASGVATNLYPLVSGTVVASTSGTSIDFTGIPAWVKRLTIVFSGVSTNGVAVPIVQLGDSGGIEATGYLGHGGFTQNAGASGVTSFTTGFGISAQNNSACVYHGHVVLTSLGSGNTWVAAGVLARSDAVVLLSTGGSKSLSDTLDRVRITTTNGTDTFDAGSINILYE